MSKKITVKKHNSPMSQSSETHIIVTEETQLMNFLLEQFPNKGRNKVKALLTHRQVSVDGKVTTQYNQPLTAGQHVLINWTRTGNEDQLKGINILFEDSDLIVIEKPAGLLSIAAASEKEATAYHLLMNHVRNVNPRNRVFIVHRLDRETSGVMMFAKSEKVQQLMQNAWKEAVLDRRYVALVEGFVTKSEGTVVSWLKETKTYKMYSSQTPNDGQRAVTHYTVIQTSSSYSLLEVKLETGRKNQIRVHMQDIGHSIVGDKKYGSTKNPINRLGLHALVIAFYHPITGELMRFETEIPSVFLKPFQS